LPLVVTIVAGVAMTIFTLRLVLATARVSSAILVAVAMLAYGAWVASEAGVSVRELDRDVESHDGMSLEAAAAAKVVLLAAALLGGGVPTLPRGLAGLAMLATGAVVRGLAIGRLGPSYGHRVRSPRGAIVDSGPYAVIRHPAYAGTLLGHAGLAMIFWSGWTAFAFFGLWTPVVLWRTWLEDEFLRGCKGYGDYARRVRRRLIPWVW
jgi:protein-S-isoprenylcysteine O-methyltransferase Ste14